MVRIMATLAVMLLLGFSPSWADVAALSYTGTGGQTQTVAPAQQYINPTGEIQVYLTAGLDRKVRFLLKDSGGNLVAEGVSGLVTAADTITVLGQTYYGKVLTVPAALAEGSYTLTGQILTSGGSVVSSRDYPLVVDRTPPSAGELWVWFRPNYFSPFPIMNNELVGGYDLRQIWVKGVTDAIGVAAVRFEVYDPATQALYASQAGWYNAASQEAGIGSASSFPSGVMPALDGPLGLRFIITDRAGNRTVAQAVVRYDGTCDPKPELVAVHDPSVTAEFIPGSGLVGYVAYTPGMVVQENPVKLLYRLPRSNWLDENPDYGLAPAGTQGGTLEYVDANYAYFVFTVPYAEAGKLNQDLWRFGNPRWFTSGQLTYNLVLGSGVPASPKLVSWSAYIDGAWTPEYSGNQTFAFNQATPVARLRVVAEPRPYDQVATMVQKTGYTPCTIPAGQTECLMELSWPPPAAGQTKLYSYLVQLKSADDQLFLTETPNVKALYDLAPPVITSYTLDQVGKTVMFDVNKPLTGSCIGLVKLVGAGLRAVNQGTSEATTLNGTVVSLGGDNSRVTVSYAALPEGNWQFVLQAWDEVQNLASQDLGLLALDTTAPAVQFYHEGVALADHGAVTSLGKVSFTVTDTVDPNPVVESVGLAGGPQSTAVNLAYYAQNGAYRVEYPVLYPSMGQEYRLAVTVRDAQGNRRTYTVPFSYQPPEIRLAGTAGVMNLPVLPAAVVHADGSNALRSEVVKIDEVPLTGSYDLVVLSAAGSTATVVLQGLPLAPGEQKTLPGYDFAATGGRLDLPLRAAGPGRAELLITSLAPDFPVLVVTVNAWLPELQLSATPGWEVQPLVQTQKISFSPGAGTPCRLVYEDRQARQADPLDNPACLVEVLSKPAGYRWQDGLLQGVLRPDDPLSLEYQVSIYNGGSKYILATGSQELGRLPLTDIAVDLDVPLPDQVYRRVQPLRLAAASKGNLPCKVLASPEEAARVGAYELACLVRWTQVPAGLEADAGLPVLSGKLSESGGQVLAWEVDLYTPYGTAAKVATGTKTLTAVDPPAPAFALQPGIYAQLVDDTNLVLLPEAMGYAGSVRFQSPVPDAGLTLTAVVDGQEQSTVYQPLRNITLSRGLKLGDMAVWSTKEVRLALGYTDLPELKAEKVYRVTVVPGRLEAVLTADRKGSNTTGIEARLQVGQRTRDGLHYDQAQHGAWEVEFGYIQGVNDYHCLLAGEPLPTDGVLQKKLYLPVGDLKVVAKLHLKPPAAASFYSRSFSSNVAYCQVLKGDAPAGEISSRTVSGPAPLSLLAQLKVGSEDLKVLGRSTWQLSRDQGNTWENLQAPPFMLQAALGPGRYLVRAELENKFSGAKGYTNQLAITAYDVPQVAIAGPRSVIVNTPLTLQAQVTNQGVAVPEGEAVVQWYRPGRKEDTLLHTGPTYTVTPGETGTLAYKVRVALASAVLGDAKAWRQQLYEVRVVPPLRPEVKLLAPNTMEYNTKEAQTYRFQAVAALSYGLDPNTYPVEGEWELPDGRVVSGAAVDYSPTAADAANGRGLVRYRAWIKGMKEATLAAVAKTIPVTVYDWPGFSIQVGQDYDLAPSRVTLGAWPANGRPWALEKPQYSWNLPEGVEVVRTLEGGRVVQAVFPRAGSHRVTVSVRDARGSTAEAAAIVELGEAPPFAVSFQPVYSNETHREPLSVWLRPRFSGGHPADRIQDVKYALDAPGVEINHSLGLVSGLPAGSHTIKLTATSKFGQTLAAELPVEVKPNRPPSCTVTSRSDARYIYLAADCSDPDGKVVMYRWYRDGRVVGCSNRLTVSRSDVNAPFRFEAVDDNGARYQETLNLGN